MKRLLTLLVFLMSACDTIESEGDMPKGFFSHFANRASELGSSKIIQPAVTWSPPPPVGPVLPFPVTFGIRGELVKLIDVTVPDEDAESVVVSCRAEYTTTQDSNGNQIGAVGYPGVGIIQWGVGGAINEMEFDLPTAKIPANIPPLAPADPNGRSLVTYSNGVQFSVSASHISVYVRHDGGICPILQPGVNIVGNLTPIRISCFLSPGTVNAGMQAKRSFIAVGGVGGIYYPAAVPPFPANQPLTPAGVTSAVLIPVPPMAKAVAIYRQDAALVTPPVQVWFSPANNIADTYRIVDMGVNDDDFVDMDTQTALLVVLNTSAVDIVRLRAVFDVTPM